MSDSRYIRMTTLELQALVNEGDLDADAELQRRRGKKSTPARARPVAPPQAADALRERDQGTLESMMELLVDLKTAVASLEAKIEKLIQGDRQEN